MYRNAELVWQSCVMAKLKKVLQYIESLKELQFFRNIVLFKKNKIKFLVFDKPEIEKAPTCRTVNVPGTLLVFSGEINQVKRQKSQTWRWGTEKEGVTAGKKSEIFTPAALGRGEGLCGNSNFLRGTITPGCVWQRTFLLSTGRTLSQGDTLGKGRLGWRSGNAKDSSYPKGSLGVCKHDL